MTMQLSPHFTLAEMVVSQTASRRGLDNTPGPAVIASLAALCGQVLEPVRVHYGRPVVVSSGYRAPLVNKAAGGAVSSQHRLGEAADFTVPGVANIDLAQWMMRELAYDQLIYEFGASGWIHCSWRPARRRNQELTARRVAGRTIYLPGIVL